MDERYRPTHRISVRRRNGRLVRDYPAWSRYAAKKLRDALEDKYETPCPGFSVVIEPWPDGDPRTYTEKEKHQFASLAAQIRVGLDQPTEEA